MNELLVQKDLRLRYKSFLITENGLQVKHKSLLRSGEYLLAYENVGTRIYKDNKGIYGLLFSSALVGLVSVLLYLLRNDGEGVDSSVYLFYFGISLILLLLYLLTYKRNFYLVKHGNVEAIEFLQHKPSKAAVNTFINVLIETRNTFLLNKYGQINFSCTREENYQNLVWLANNEVINNIEFNHMVDKLNQAMQQQQPHRITFDFSLN
ncbi:hypothetical protein ASE74_07915 [Pedobacter sp. Leaf216]|uniref:hypothetical protein n=1 Tax=Pedobacter sp. Leaf216 TaxID=1735684 RepID=UPI0006F4C876|nr:hypothetical protein [Pedobacter sp. Leaf216]KQM67375.1 hypothetical protein ASE74_07915 [Pedobacter sp. Leaf216]